jgi:hypothetical protein
MGRYVDLAEGVTVPNAPAETRPRVAVRVRVLTWAQWERGRLDLLISEGREMAEPAREAGCYRAVCGSTHIWLVRSGSRWLMSADSGDGRERVRSFASPWLSHSMRTAESWFGPPRDGWQADEGSRRAQP